MGAVTSAMELYVLGDVRLGFTVSLRVSAYVVFRLKIGFVKISISISFSVSLSITISAALAVALSRKGIGFDGSARVEIGVAGFRIGGRVPFRYNSGLVSTTRATLRRLMPPVAELVKAKRVPSGGTPGPEAITDTAGDATISEAKRASTVLSPPGPAIPTAALDGSMAELVSATADVPQHWSVRFKVAAWKEDKCAEIWLLFLPDPEEDPTQRGYPKLLKEDRDKTIAELIAERPSAVTFNGEFLKNYECAGFLGTDGQPENPVVGSTVIRWHEDLDRTIATAEEVKARAKIESIVDYDEPPALTLRDFLFELDEDVEGDKERPDTEVEVVDPRTKAPSSDDTDAADRKLGGSKPSSRIVRRDGVVGDWQNESGDAPGYDELVAGATDPNEDSESNDKTDGGGVSTPLLAAELFQMFHRNDVQAGIAADGVTTTPLRAALVFRLREGVELEQVKNPTRVKDIIDTHADNRLVGTRAVISQPLSHEIVQREDNTTWCWVKSFKPKEK